jgi:hypothetical protein
MIQVPSPDLVKLFFILNVTYITFEFSYLNLIIIGQKTFDDKK